VNTITESSDATRGFVTQSNGSTYSYDADGNMTVDQNKGITSIVYNQLNLPTQINFTNNRVINFLYDAGGNKLRKTVVNNGTTLYTQDYVNGIEYKNNVLEAIYHSEGRVTNIDGSLKYEYAMKDHLGNTRLMFCDRNGDGVIKPENAPEPSEVTQENSYYAFGMNMDFGAWENTPSVTDNLHLYNGKELNTDFGLNWNDYGARFYDPATARWNVMDPKSEKIKNWNPYNYTMNNPMRFIDPDGMAASDPPNGNVSWKWATANKGSDGKYYMQYQYQNANKAQAQSYNSFNASNNNNGAVINKDQYNDINSGKSKEAVGYAIPDDSKGSITVDQTKGEGVQSFSLNVPSDASNITIDLQYDMKEWEDNAKISVGDQSVETGNRVGTDSSPLTMKVNATNSAKTIGLTVTPMSPNPKAGNEDPLKKSKYTMTLNVKSDKTVYSSVDGTSTRAKNEDGKKLGTGKKD